MLEKGERGGGDILGWEYPPLDPRFIYKDLYKPSELGNHAEISHRSSKICYLAGESLNLDPR